MGDRTTIIVNRGSSGNSCESKPLESGRNKTETELPILRSGCLPGIAALIKDQAADSFQQQLADYAHRYGGILKVVLQDPKTIDATIQVYNQAHVRRTDYSKTLVVTFLDDKIVLEVVGAKGIEYSGKSRDVDPLLSASVNPRLTMSSFFITDFIASPEKLLEYSKVAIDGVGAAIDAWKKLGSKKLKFNQDCPIQPNYSNTHLDNFIREMTFSHTSNKRFDSKVCHLIQKYKGDLIYSFSPVQNIANRIIHFLQSRQPPELTLTIDSATDKNVRLRLAISGSPIAKDLTYPHREAAIFTKAFLLALSQISDPSYESNLLISN